MEKLLSFGFPLSSLMLPCCCQKWHHPRHKEEGFAKVALVTPFQMEYQLSWPRDKVCQFLERQRNQNFKSQPVFHFEGGVESNFYLKTS